MKESINLLIEEQAGGEKQSFQVLILPGLGLFLLVGLLVGTVLKAPRVAALRQEVEGLNKQREELNQSISRLAGFTSVERQDTEGQQDRVLPGSPVVWSQLLRELGQRLPGTVWLTHVESYTLKGTDSTGATDGKELRITGIAHAPGDVEGLLSAIEGSTLWNDVRLVYVQKMHEPSQEGMEFEVTARLK
jgi:Tfp pilus assembly protein PilN